MPFVSLPMRPRALPFASDAPIPGLRRKAVLLSLLIQAVIGAFVLSQVNRLPPSATDDTPLQVEWIPATPVPPPASPPPTSTPKPALPAPLPATPVASEPVAEVAPSAPLETLATSRLQNQISAWAEPVAPTPSPRIERWRGQPLPRLPGREEAFVEGIHTAIVPRHNNACRPSRACFWVRGPTTATTSPARCARTSAMPNVGNLSKTSAACADGTAKHMPRRREPQRDTRIACGIATL